MVNGIRAFLPGSLVDMRPVKDTTPYEGKTLEFKVIKLDRKRNNVVLSRRAVVEASLGEERQKLLETLKEGASSRVSSRTSPTTARSWTWAASTACCTSPTWHGVVCVTRAKCCRLARITAKILKFDQEKNRVSLGLKQLGEDPWVGISRRYPQGTRLFGKVTNMTDYGAFVEVEGHRRPGARVRNGLDQQERRPSKVVQLGDEVEVMVLEIDEDRVVSPWA
jgi:small subunit ribosomal protein S1